MNHKDFIKQNIVKHLTGLGLKKSDAEYSASKALRIYDKQIRNSKDPFRQACDYAGIFAQQASTDFKYTPPRR